MTIRTMGWRQCLFLVLSAFLLLAAKVVSQRLRHRKLAKHWNTEPVKNHKGVFQTTIKMWRDIRSSDSGYFLQRSNQDFESVNATTLSLTLPSFRQLLICSSPENMKALFSTQESEFNLGMRGLAFGPLLRNGIFTSEGHKWKHSRNLLKPSFSRDQVGQVQTLEPHVQSLAKQIRKMEGKVFDIEFLSYAFTLDAATHFLYGESVNILQKHDLFEQDDDFDVSLDVVGRYSQSRSMLFELYWLSDSRLYRRSIKSLNEFTDRYVEKALNMRPEELEAHSKEGYIFLYELVKDTRNPIELRVELLNIMMAGRATTASLLSSVFSELSRNPEIWRTLREEVIRYFGTGDDAEEIKSITFEKLKRCTYLKWVINETLRLWPPVPQNLRKAAKDTTLPRGGGEDGQAPIFVSKGTAVVISVFATHRSKKLYGEDADQFRPDRWAGLTKIGWGFMPFGSGPRVCLGQQFALTEVSYVLVRLAQMFETFESDGSPYPPKTLSNIVIKYADGVNVRMM